MLKAVGTGLRWALVAVAALLMVWAFIDVGARTIGAARTEAEGVRLRILFWGDNRERAIVDELVEAFEAQNPGIDVVPLHAADFDTKLKTMLVAGDPPDAFYMPYERMLGQLALDEQIRPLDEFIEQEKTEDPGWYESFYPQLWPAFQWDGQTLGKGELYAIPKGFTTLGCYVNTDLFDRAGIDVPYDGWTWSEYEEAAKKITALSDPEDPNKKIYGAVIQTWPEVMRAHVWSGGGEYFGSPDGTYANIDFTDVAIDTPATLDAIGLWVRGREEGWIYNATGIALAEAELFRLGRVGVIGPLGRWMTPTYRKVDFNWDVVPLPVKDTMPEGFQAPNPLVTVGWSMAADTEHPQETWKLIKFLCGERGQRLIAELGLEIPSLRFVAESPSFHAEGQLPANSQMFIDAVEADARVMKMPLRQEFRRFIEEEIQNKALVHFERPENALPLAAERVESRWEYLRSSPLIAPDLPKMPWTTLTVISVFVVLAGVIFLWRWSKAQQLGSLDRAEERTGWLFVGLWIAGFALFTLGPMVVSLLLSLSTWTATGPLADARFVGLDNFGVMFTRDASFYQSIKVTVYYTVLAVPIMQVASILVALLMNLAVKGIALFRTMYFVPSVVSGVALVTLWITIFDNSSGLLNASINAPFQWFGERAPGWLTPDWFGKDAQWAASPALVIMGLWAVGGGMVIYLAALKNVPRSLYEAAYLDGAGPVRRFFSVTLPMISPIVFFQVVMAIIASFQIFTQAFVIRGSTGGVNESLLFYVLNLYDQAFRFHNMGYASAMAWVLFLAILGLTMLVFRGSKGLVHYEGLK